MALTKVLDAGLNTPASDLQDNEKIILGAGDDMQLYHDGNHNIIKGAQSILLKKDDSESYVRCIADGAVSLHHNNIEVLKTQTNGIFVKGPEGGDATLYLYADEGDDDADQWGLLASTGGDFSIRNYAGGGWETNIKTTGGGNVELYHDNSKKFETYASGTLTTGNLKNTGSVYVGNQIDGDDTNSTGQLMFGASNDLKIFHQADNLIDSYGQNVKIRNRNTDGGVTENMITMSPNGAVGLFHDNIKTCQTDANGIQVLGPEGGDAYLKLYADEGDDNDDLWRIVASSTGNFHIQNASSGSYENNIVADGNGAVELYHDNVKKLETTSSGINIGCNLNTNLFDYLRFGASQFGAADIRPVNETNHKVGLAFYVDGTQDTTINPTEKVRIQAGGGISFNGDSAEANALNDYEYGAWTATASQGNVDSLSCRYQKIGHIVWVWGAVDDFTDRTGTSDIRITGLPFTVSENGYGTSIFYRVAFSDSTGEIGCLINTSEEVKFLVSSQGGSEAWFYLDYEDLNSSTSQIKFSGWYRTTQ